MAGVLGKHLLVELCGCDEGLLNDSDFLLNRCITAARRMRATVVGKHAHRFDPVGVSIVLILAESHLSLHSWPEHGFASLDVFTCGGNEPSMAADFLAKSLEADEVRTLDVVRGLVAPVSPRWRVRSLLVPEREK